MEISVRLFDHSILLLDRRLILRNDLLALVLSGGWNSMGVTDERVPFGDGITTSEVLR